MPDILLNVSVWNHIDDPTKAQGLLNHIENV